MISEILTAAGVQARRGRFVKPPGGTHVKPSGGTYAVWTEGITTDGPDGMPPLIFTHDVTVELYEPKPDDAAEAAVEAQMSARGLHWTKDDRLWIQSEQFYQVIYNITYTQKRRY